MNDRAMIEKAQALCKVAHGTQTRKYSDNPYWIHPFAVAEIVKSVTPHDINAQCAAYLHDVIEDTVTTYKDVTVLLNKEIADLVLELTDISRPSDGNRRRRKEIDRQHLKEASPEGKTIKLADLIDNSKSIIECDPSFAQVYMREMRDLLEVLKEGNPQLFKRAQSITTSYFKRRSNQEIR